MMLSGLSKNLLIGLALFSIFMIGCDELLNPDDESKDETLHVKFLNDSLSVYTITNIQLKAMGRADEEADTTNTGEWSDNILKKGETIAPGEYKFFDLDIPNLHYSLCRIGVDDGSGHEVMIDEQPNYQNDGVFTFVPTITHWGSDDRTVRVCILYYAEKDLIYIQGYGDNAGIE